VKEERYIHIYLVIENYIYQERILASAALHNQEMVERYALFKKIPHHKLLLTEPNFQSVKQLV
jgi:hypothetical protein